MQNFVKTLREKANEAIANPDSPVKNSHDLAVKANIDPGNLSKFLKATDGKYDRISFNQAAQILYCIGGRIVFPGEGFQVETQRVKELLSENAELKVSVRTLQETIAMLATTTSTQNTEEKK